MYGHLNTDKRKWVTIVEYVDIETGEIITKSVFEREYYKTGKKHKKYNENEKFRITTLQFECRRKQQLTIW